MDVEDFGVDDASLFLSVGQVARVLGRHPRTLRNWRVENTGPIAVRIGHKWAYPRSSVADYIDGLVAQAAQAAQARELSREESAHHGK